MNFMALIITLLSGLFFVLGFLIVKLSNNKKILSVISISMSFVVILGMIFMDLIPEINEEINKLNYSAGLKIFLIIIFTLFGFFAMKLLDNFVPNHEHNHQEHEKNNVEHNEHSKHVGFVSSISLLIHNILEGMSIYVVGLETITGGILFSIGVGLHNLPLGIEIASSSVNSKNNKKYIMMNLLLVLSGVFGALLLIVLKKYISSVVLVSLMCISLGMLLYLELFELLKEIFNYKKKKELFYGFILGILLVSIIIFMN